ncbi:MAG TPA: helix-turn-helix domain-containing protein [Pseudonocardiaceae bacterium]|nr:helix-turn-helix domain-containing protein [Pseudonocardiaceae bacterium]
MAKPAGGGESVISRVVRIFDALAAADPALSAPRVAELARRCGLPVATTARLVDELVGNGWLVRDGDRRVRIGVRLAELALGAVPVNGLRATALPFMADLHLVTGQGVRLGVLHGREVQIVAWLPRGAAPPRVPLPTSSTGLLLLAHAPARLQEEILTEQDPVRAALDRVRRTGFAAQPGCADLAVPIRVGEQVVAALALIMPGSGASPGYLPALRAAALGVARGLIG